MKKYLTYHALDFAADESFIRWVKGTSTSDDENSTWEHWVIAHPEQSDAIAEAKQIVLRVASIGELDDNEVADRLWARIDSSIANDMQRTKIVPMQVPTKSKAAPRYLKYAASAAMLLIASAAFWVIQGSYLDNVAAVIFGNATYTNDDEVPMSVLLADGSSIILYDNTTLEVLPDYNENSREVKVSGKAFFEVQKNPKKPFIVQSNGLTTRVLGTSFLITAYQDNDVTVSVNTGKVSVYKSNSGSEVEIITLLPQEQVVMDKSSLALRKNILKEGDAGTNVDYKESFIFLNQPLADVFELLEKRYGVDILVDTNKIKSCYLNASLVGIPLEDKIRMICKTSNLEYKVNNKVISIIGEGCQQP